jgi:hypothetical protein
MVHLQNVRSGLERHGGGWRVVCGAGDPATVAVSQDEMPHLVSAVMNLEGQVGFLVKDIWHVVDPLRGRGVPRMSASGLEPEYGNVLRTQRRLRGVGEGALGQCMSIELPERQGCRRERIGALLSPTMFATTSEA